MTQQGWQALTKSSGLCWYLSVAQEREVLPGVFAFGLTLTSISLEQLPQSTPQHSNSGGWGRSSGATPMHREGTPERLRGYNATALCWRGGSVRLAGNPVQRPVIQKL